MAKPLICSICGGTIKPNWHGWAGGNAAWPITDGRCCDDCDQKVVIPARLAGMGYADRKAKQET